MNNIEQNWKIMTENTNNFETKAIENNLEQEITKMTNKLNAIEATIARPGREVSRIDNTETHKSAFNEYIRKGLESGLTNFEQKALSVSSDADGGYLVTRDMQHKIFDNLATSVVMRRLASIQRISTDGIEIVEDYQNLASGWTSESGVITDTETPKLSKKFIQVHEMYAQPKATQKLIDDASINIENWLEDKIASSFAKTEEYSFINGDGLGKPRGILSYPEGTEWGQIERIKTIASGEIAADDLLMLTYSLNEKFMHNAVFLMNRKTAHMLRNMKNEKGEYIWAPGLEQNSYNTLLGIPVVLSEAMPMPSKGAAAIALADFKAAYMVVDRSNISVMRDPFTEKPFVKFYTTKRVGGDVVNYEAIKLLTIS